MNAVRKTLVAAVCAAALIGGGSATAGATPPTGQVSATPIARGTIPPLELKAPGFELEQNHSSDFVVAHFTIKPGGSLGWHRHPGPVLISVQKGTLTIEHADCTYSRYHAGSAEVEAPRQVHNAWNTSRRTTVKGTAVYLNVPVGGLQRIDAKAPRCARH
jgi:quercetin dioxygenase-like cupin family protein